MATIIDLVQQQTELTMRKVTEDVEAAFPNTDKNLLAKVNDECSWTGFRYARCVQKHYYKREPCTAKWDKFAECVRQHINKLQSTQTSTAPQAKGGH